MHNPNSEQQSMFAKSYTCHTIVAIMFNFNNTYSNVCSGKWKIEKECRVYTCTTILEFSAHVSFHINHEIRQQHTQVLSVEHWLLPISEGIQSQTPVLFHCIWCLPHHRVTVRTAIRLIAAQFGCHMYTIVPIHNMSKHLRCLAVAHSTIPHSNPIEDTLTEDASRSPSALGT